MGWGSLELHLRSRSGGFSMLLLAAANFETASCRSRQSGVCVPTHLANWQSRNGRMINLRIALQ